MKDEKYLGLPLVLGQSKKGFFEEIQSRIDKRIQGWKERLLSKAGQEVLIKSIAQAIPNYVMSCFLFPKFILDGIRSLITNFWWGQRKGEKKMHWVSWAKLLCCSKFQGGHGFIDLYCFNMSLLAKQGWRILQNPTSLVARCLKARYFKNCSFLDAHINKNFSYLWRSIAAARGCLKKAADGELAMDTQLEYG